MRTLQTLALLAALAAPTVAHADTIFDLTNVTFSAGETATGTITINTVTGTVTGTNIIVGGVTVTSLPGIGSYPLYQSLGYAATGSPTFDLPGSTLVGYAGGALCSYTAPCGTGYGSDNFHALFTGSLIAESVAVTPEPSSLLLLGTGILGLASAARRRLIPA